MKKLGRNLGKLETLNLFSMLQDHQGGTLYDPANRKSFLTQVNSGLATALSSESTLHGVRAQSMFEGMIANFGAARLIKQEDSGDCYYDGEDIALPDFRVITKANKSLLIETKSHYPKNPHNPYRIRLQDLNSLRTYANVTATSLRIAIYWARWNLWTLNDFESFSLNQDHAEIDLGRAMAHSEMATLGDFNIGTKFPLTLRLIADLKSPRTIAADGLVGMRVGSFEMTCGDVLITDPVEQNIALYLMMYGSWEYDGGRVERDEEGLPTATVHSSSPAEHNNPGEHFEMIGSLSSLYSQLYNTLTLNNGTVERLRVNNPSSIAPIIPLKFEKKALPLWRFVLQPNKEDYEAQEPNVGE